MQSARENKTIALAVKQALNQTTKKATTKPPLKKPTVAKPKPKPPTDSSVIQLSEAEISNALKEALAKKKQEHFDSLLEKGAAIAKAQ